MKAVTVHQPWAQLIVVGEKRFETRSWKTSHRGRLAIHSGRTFPESARELCFDPPVRTALARHNFNKPSVLPRGAIIGFVHVIDCVPAEAIDIEGEAAAEAAFGNFRAGRWAWALSHPVLLSQPIPCPGRLGVFEVPEAIFEAALAQAPLVELPIDAAPVSLTLVGASA